MVAEVLLRVMGTIGTVLAWSWWLIIIVVMFAVKKRWSRHPIDVIIIEKRGDNLIKTNERAGRIFDKETEVTKYQLAKSKETMPVINFEWMLHNADKHMNILEKIIQFLRPTIGTVFLIKYGSKQYKPIRIGNKDEVNSLLKLKEIKDKDGSPLYRYEYSQFVPRWVLGVLDFEIIDWDNMNFMVQEQRASIMRRGKGLDWMKQLAIPAMIIAGSVIASLFILKFSADAAGDFAGVASKPPAESSGGIIGGAIDDIVTPGA